MFIGGFAYQETLHSNIFLSFSKLLNHTFAGKKKKLCRKIYCFSLTDFEWHLTMQFANPIAYSFMKTMWNMKTFRQSAALRMGLNCACQGIIPKAPSNKSYCSPKYFSVIVLAARANTVIYIPNNICHIYGKVVLVISYGIVFISKWRATICVRWHLQNCPKSLTMITNE